MMMMMMMRRRNKIIVVYDYYNYFNSNKLVSELQFSLTYQSFFFAEIEILPAHSTESFHATMLTSSYQETSY
jgi:hypothetical protein